MNRVGASRYSRLAPAPLDFKNLSTQTRPGLAAIQKGLIPYHVSLH